MDGPALKLAQDTAIDAQAKRIPAGYESKVAALPSDYKLVDMEQFDAGRRRFRGKMVTASLEDFAAYVKDKKGGHGFVDDEKASATVFFNLGNPESPGHGDYTATLQLAATPAYKALQEAVGEAMDQGDLIDFLEDWQHIVRPFTELGDGEGGSVFADGKLSWAVAAIRKIKIAEGSTTETTRQNFSAAQSRLDSVEASSSEGLPAGFQFRVAPYLGLSERTVFLRLSIKTGGRVPMLQLRIIGADQLKEDIRQEFKRVLAESIGVDASLTIGKFTP